MLRWKAAANEARRGLWKLRRARDRGRLQFSTFAQNGCCRSPRVRTSSRIVATLGWMVGRLPPTAKGLPLTITDTRPAKLTSSGESQILNLPQPGLTLTPLVAGTTRAFVSAADVCGLEFHSA